MRGHLIQIDARDAAGAQTRYLASADHPSLCHLNGQQWTPAIARLPSLGYDFFGGDFRGAIVTPSARFAVAADGMTAFTTLRFAGARVRIYTGTIGDTFASFTLRFDGRIGSEPTVSAGIASFDAGPDDAWLDKPLLGLFAGTGGVEGPSDLTGTVKPLALGACRFAPGVLIDVANNIYRVSGHGAVQGITAAYDRVVSLGASSGNHLDLAALTAATIASGRWATCNALGLVRLGAPADGQVSFDVSGDNAGAGGYVRLPGAMIRRIAELAGGTVSTANLAALDTARAWNLAFVLTAQTTAREAIQAIADSVCAVAGVTLTGTLFVAPLGYGTSSLTLNSDGTALPPVASVEVRPVAAPFWRLATEAEPTWVVHAPDSVASEYVLRGLYSAARTYRLDDLVESADGSAWVYVNATAGAGNAPPTWPTTSNAWWNNLTPPTSVDFSTQVVGATKPANNATVGATAGTNLRNNAGTLLGDADVITAQGISLNISQQLDAITQLTTASAGAIAGTVWRGTGTNPSHIKPIAGVLRRVTGNNTWDASIIARAHRRNVVVRAGSSNTAGHFYMIGLADAASITAEANEYNQLRYVWYFDNNGTWRIFESGANIGSFGVPAAEDVARIEYSSGEVRYYLNDTLHRTVQVPLRKIFYPAAVIYSGYIPNVSVRDFSDGEKLDTVDGWATIGRNMVPNAGAEGAVTAPWVAWGISGVCSFSTSAVSFRSGSRSFLLTKDLVGSTIVVSSAARPVVPGRTYTIRAWVQAGVASSSGGFLRVFAKATQVDNVTGDFENTNFDIGHENFAVPAVMTLKEGRWTCPANMYWASVVIYNTTNGPVAMYFDEVSMTEVADYFYDVGGAQKPEDNAQVNRFIEGVPLSFLTDPVGTVPHLPRFQTLNLFVNGAAVTSGVTWAASVVTGTATVSISGTGAGTLSINATTGVLSNSLIRVTATYLGLATVADIPLRLIIPPPPNVAPGQGTGTASSMNVSVSYTGASTEFYRILTNNGESMLRVNTGANGTVKITLDVEYSCVDLSVSRILDALITESGGANSPVQSAQTTVSASQPGKLTLNYTVTGLPANTQRLFYAQARIALPQASSWSASGVFSAIGT